MKQPGVGIKITSFWRKKRSWRRLLLSPFLRYLELVSDLAPENLSRTLEDSGTVTSVLIPWHTCGAYQSGVLGVSTWSYLPYAFFNIISPFMTLLFAAFNIKIKQLRSNL